MGTSFRLEKRKTGLILRKGNGNPVISTMEVSPMDPESGPGLRIAIHLDAILVLALVALVAVLLKLLL